jgi:starvation-inducible DNA-binding protein
MVTQDAKVLRIAPLETPTDLKPDAVKEISGALRILLADMFALYVKTKNYHWHMSGPHFRDYHLLLDEQAEQIFATTDDIAERARKIGGTTIRSIGNIARLQRVKDNDADFVTPLDMLAELRDDNKQLTANMRETHGLTDELGDIATTSLLENWIDEAERRTWFLYEVTRFPINWHPNGPKWNAPCNPQTATLSYRFNLHRRRTLCARHCRALLCGVVICIFRRSRSMDCLCVRHAPTECGESLRKEK